MRTLYHPDGHADVWGVTCKFKSFEIDEVQEALKAGWFESPLDFNSEPIPEQGSDHEAELRARIKALGGKAGGRASIATLEKQLAELEGKEDGDSDD